MGKKAGFLRDLGICVGILGVTFLACLVLQHFEPAQALVAMVLVLAVFLISIVTDGYLWGILASLLSVLIDNFVFAFPYFAFDFLTPVNLMSAVVMLIVAVMTSTLTTKLKRQERARAEGEMEKMRANLLRAISHDLRTPLTTIYGSCSAVMENYDDLSKQQQMRLLEDIRQDSEGMIRMVENLLSVTRIGAGQVQVAKTPTVLEELIDTTLVKFQKLYPEAPVQVRIPDAFVSIPMDALLIQQVLVNLLENAVVHGRGMTQLQLTVELAGTKAWFQVADNGCGIPKERLHDLFSGYRVSQDTPADGGRGGMGIGLSVCASIIKAHGGEITGENRAEGGAVFRFWLEMEEIHEQ